MCQRLLHIASVAGRLPKKKIALRKNLLEKASPEFLTDLLFMWPSNLVMIMAIKNTSILLPLPICIAIYTPVLWA